MKAIDEEIGRVQILCVRGGEYQEWEVWVQRETGNDHTREPVRMGSGEPRFWVSAEAALRWVLSQPYKGPIEVMRDFGAMYYG